MSIESKKSMVMRVSIIIVFVLPVLSVAQTSVKSIVDLQHTPPEMSFAIVRGRETIDDGGGGTFYWDPNDNSPEDGGTTIASKLNHTGRWKRVREGTVLNVRWFGAKGNGARGNGNSIQSAIDAATSGATVYVPEGSYQVTVPLTVGAKSLTLKGDGQMSYLWSDLPGPIIRKSGHAAMLRVEGIRFDTQHPGGVGLEFDDPELVETQSADLSIANCTFVGNGGGVRILRARETSITDCRFVVSGSGIYLRDASNPTVIGCYFSPLEEGPGTKAIHYDGVAASVWSAGLRVVGCTIMGCAVGIEISGTDFASITSSLIDYCDTPIRFVDQDDGLIQGSFIGSRGNRLTKKAVAIEILGRSQRTQHIKIADNMVVTYAEAADKRTGILVNNVHGLKITGNTIHFWNVFGIDNTDCQRVFIEGNSILSSPENSGTPIANPTSGEAEIPANSPSVVVNHGLGIHPARVFLTPRTAVACGVTTMNASQFTIQLPSAFPYPIRVFWKVEE